MVTRIAIAIAACAAAWCSYAQADRFGSGDHAFEIEFVTIGDPGNPADTTGDPSPAGSVPYVYRIGKFEVPEDAVRKANALSEMAGDPLGITLDERGPQKPATRISWFEAARFVIWLNEDQGHHPAYKFDVAGDFQLWAPGDAGYDPANPFRNSRAIYVLPSVDEWYKSAFYDPVLDIWWDYPTGSDDPPTPVAFGTNIGTAVYQQTSPADVVVAGGESRYGTIGQGGNAWEWNESASDLSNDGAFEVRDARGFDWGLTAIPPVSMSSFGRVSVDPSRSNLDLGFRVARVPEPSTVLVLAVGFLFRVGPVARRFGHRMTGNR